MRKTRFVFVASLLVAGARGARDWRRRSGGQAGRRSRRRGSTSARTTTRAGRRPTTKAVCPCRRRSARKVETTYKENVPEGPQACQVIESLIRDGNKIIFATSFGFQTAMVAAAKKHPDVQVRDGDRHHRPARTWPSTSAPARTRSTSSGMAAGAATKKGVDRLRRRRSRSRR